MFKNFLKKLFKNKETLPIQTEGLKTVSLWTAGIKFDSRIDHVLNCNVHDEVQLVREPGNENDPNAIHVKRFNGESIGFIGRSRAALISSLLDENKIASSAHIIDLKCDLLKEEYGVKIAFNVHPDYYSLFTQKEQNIDIAFDKSTNHNLYLLLSCEEHVLSIVKELFKTNNINIYRSGVSYKAANNGRFYDWYFFLNEEVDEQFIYKILEERFPILQKKSTKEFNEEYLYLQEEELDDLKKSSTELIEENTALKKQLEKSNRLLSRLDDHFQKSISAFFPDVIFVEPSLDVLQGPDLDFSNPIREIKKIVFDDGFRGKPIKTMDNWYDIHFNTGKRNDGRIYFKKEKGVTTILVSFKVDQTKDIKRLAYY